LIEVSNSDSLKPRIGREDFYNSVSTSGKPLNKRLGILIYTAYNAQVQKMQGALESKGFECLLWNLKIINFDEELTKGSKS
jgi:hypothetical protein